MSGYAFLGCHEHDSGECDECLECLTALVDAARRLLNGGDCTCDPAPKGARVDVCATCEMRAALGALR